MRWVGEALRGARTALAAHPVVFASVTLAVAALNVAAPVAILSAVRKPLDFYTFNPPARAASRAAWAPVIPVLGLAFVGLESGTLHFLAGSSRVATIALLVVLVLAVGHLGCSTCAVGENGRK